MLVKKWRLVTKQFFEVTDNAEENWGNCQTRQNYLNLFTNDSEYFEI